MPKLCRLPLARLIACGWLPLVLLALAGCPQPREGIAVSNTFLDFDQNPLPRTLFVWNTDAERGQLVIAVSATEPWILPSVTEVRSEAPDEEGNTDRRAVTVDVDRTQLPQGTFTGFLEFSSPGQATVRVGVRVVQPTDGRRDPLALEKIRTLYSEPFLLDFNFALKDEAGRPIVAAPEEFDVLARENEKPVGDETGVHLRQTSARQLKIFLVLDYSLSLQNAPGAIPALESAATSILLPTLNEDAQVGVVEFHRDDREPSVVSPLSVDRAATVETIASIQPDVVQGFASGSRLWDAVTRAAVSFGPSDPRVEERYIVAFSDGNDTSSFRTVDNAVSEATQRDIAVYTVGYGSGVNEEALRDISQRTGGIYFSAANSAALGPVFTQIAQNLAGQYLLRWATLRRNNVPFTPSFQLALDNELASYTAEGEYVPRDYFGNVLEGQLRFIQSPTLDGVTVYLRADYVPRQVDALRFYVETDAPFDLSTVPAADDGLIEDWLLSTDVDPEFGGTWITASSAGDPLPFATFGPLLRFDFPGLAPDAEPPVTRVYFDDSIYAQGQFFRVLDYANVPPGQEEEGEGEGGSEGEGEGGTPGLDVDFCAGFQSAFEESLPPEEGELPEGEGEGVTYDATTELLKLFDPAVADINGTFFVEENEEFDLVFNITGNGILDADNELGVLRRILGNGSFDNGVLSHDEVRAAFEQNLATYREEYLGAALSGVIDALYPGIAEIVVGYITLGDGSITQISETSATGAGSFGIAAGITAVFDQVARELIGIGFTNSRLDKADFTSFPELSLNGDADGDTYTNFEEYRCTLPTSCFTPSPPSLADRLYVNNALNANLRALPCLDNKRLAL